MKENFAEIVGMPFLKQLNFQRVKNQVLSYFADLYIPVDLEFGYSKLYSLLNWFVEISE